jgi:type I restriction enzyme, S subunit
MKKGWETKTLGEIADVQSGGTPLVSNKIFWNGNLPWYASGELNDLYTSAPERHVSALGIENSNAKLFPEGSLLIGMYDTAALKMSILDRAGAFNQAIAGVRPNQGIDLIFVLHAINAIKESVLGQRRGVRQKNLSLGKIREIPIPVPPLAEQQRIVGLLDEAFEGIATAKANAEKNLQNARALFESHLQSVFSQRGKGWVDRQLATLCHGITVGHVGSMKTEYKPDGVPFLRSQNIRPFEVSMENAMFIDQKFHRALKKSQLRPGDLAIVRTGYPGTAAVIPPELPDSNCSDLVIVRPGKEVDPHFLAAFFNSAFGKQLVLGKIVGAAQKHFNVTAAKEVMLHVPPLPEQHKIINLIDALRSETQRLATLYTRKLAALEALKKSLLHQAFSGEL